MTAIEEVSAPILEEVVEGTIKSLEGADLLISLPGGATGLLATSELKGKEAKPGETLKVFVDAPAPGGYRLSKDKADRLAIWGAIEEAFEKQTIVQGEIVGLTEGGFSVDIGTKAFLPGSQLDIVPVRDVERYMHRPLEFKIIRFNKGRANIVISRRVIIEEARKKTVEKLIPGAVVEGTVQSFTDYGAFVDLGGIAGLLHVTDMSWGRVRHPSEIVELGQRVKVKVLRYDAESQKVSLGIRQLQEDPWADAERKYAAGTTVRGPVVSITDYGMFLALEQGVEGLLHTSGPVPGADRARELSRKVSIGDEVDAIVLELDAGKKRISLGMKT